MIILFVSLVRAAEREPFEDEMLQSTRIEIIHDDLRSDALGDGKSHVHAVT